MPALTPLNTGSEAIAPRRALADLHYNEIIAGDSLTSDDDDYDDDQPPRPLRCNGSGGDIENDDPDEARNAIGVSISRAQTRLASPKTPAIEKQAALERAGGFFGDLNDTLVEEESEDKDEDSSASEGLGAGRPTPPIPERSPRRTPVRVPSPSVSGSKPESHTSVTAQKDGKPRTGLLSGLPFTRRRAATAGSESVLESWHRTIFSNIPLLRKNSSGNVSESGAQESASPKRPGSAHATVPPRRSPSPGESEEAKASVGELPDMQQIQPLRPRPGVLRRSTSDGSLVTTRTLSRVSSLGDDSRFEDVREQVNSRFKAIKDSWQDSSLKLPNMPKSLSMSSFTPDFFREHTGPLGTRKQDTRQAPNGTRISVGGYEGIKPRKPVDPITRQPYHSVRDFVTDSAAAKHTTHPHFNRAVAQLKGDVVILGGYRGSILRSAEPPHHQVWVPIKVGLNLRKVNLEVGFEEDADERATETIIPGGMLTHIGPVDIARRLFKRLRGSENVRSGKLRVHDYGYDWRLHPTFLSNQLVEFLKSLPCNQPGVPEHERGATVIAHSLGGLITRHAVNQHPELFKGVVYAGVPRTCVNILGPFRNGDDVLLSSRVLTAQVNFSIRTSFALLPLDGQCFFDKHTKEEYPVDFFDPQTWVEHRLSPCLARPLLPRGTTPEKPSGLTGYVSSVANALPNLPIPGRHRSRSRGTIDPVKATMAGPAAEPDTLAAKGDSASILANGNVDDEHEETPDEGTNSSTSVGTSVTISRDVALSYLTRTLATVKQFKQRLAFEPTHAAANSYPPLAVIYGKSTPTVYGAKVVGRDGIKRADAYDELAFASGDGVVLARAAMVPEGYRTARGGVVSSERGHVTLLGDLEAVGQCLNAIAAARRKGVGLGKK